MTTREEFVDSCLIKYRHEIIPKGMHWEDAHDPLPKCLGGDTTKKLWLCDHILHNLLQREEFDTPCICGMTRERDLQILSKYYPEHLELYDKWWKEGQRRAAIKSVESRRLNQTGFFDPDRPYYEGQRKGSKTVGQDNVRLQRGRYDPEVHKKASQNGARSQHKQQWMCTVTGYVTTPAPLSRYQNARGIDTSHRIRIK